MLRQVYQAEAEAPSRAFLDPTNKHLYIIEEDLRLKVIDWKADSLVTVADFSELPCSWRGRPARGDLENIQIAPMYGFALLGFCNSIYRVSLPDWHVQSQLVDARTAYGAMFEYAEKGGWFAVIHGRYFPEGGGGDWKLTLYSGADLEIANSWSVPGNNFTFTPDGNSLIVMNFGRVAGQPTEGVCRAHMYEVPSGLLTRTIDLQLDGRNCPALPLKVLATDPSVLIGETFRLHAISFWDLRTGRLIREIKEGREVTNAAASPDGRWVFGSVWVRGAPSQQDFKIWSAQTGAVVYESPAYVAKIVPGEPNNHRPYGTFSADAIYLVIAVGESVRVFKIDRHE